MDKSISLTSEDDLRVCAASGVFTKSFLCDFQCHHLKLTLESAQSAVFFNLETKSVQRL